MKSYPVAPLVLWCASLLWATTCQGAGKSDYWIDPDTHLMWTAADNGSGLSWIQAQRYCRDLTLAGFHNWTLPSIDDLQRLVGGADAQSALSHQGSHQAQRLAMEFNAWETRW